MKASLTKQARAELHETLANRFAKHRGRHPRTTWDRVIAKLREHAAAERTLDAMERTGGEPDVVEFPQTGDLVFCDCSAESPQGRRSLCYDRDALNARKENKPKSSALQMAAEIGIALLDEAQYRHLQTLGAFDTRTSSWIATPPDIRGLGGALFCDRRYDTVFVYHNGAESYYAARGFRGAFIV